MRQAVTCGYELRAATSCSPTAACRCSEPPAPSPSTQLLPPATSTSTQLPACSARFSVPRLVEKLRALRQPYACRRRLMAQAPPRRAPFSSPTRDTPMRRALHLLAAASRVAAAPAAAQPPLKTLAKPDAEYAEPFTQINGVRELKDGRVIVSDVREKTVQLVDLKTGSAQKIGREGSG